MAALRILWTRWVADWTDLRSTVAMMPQLCLLLALILDISRVHAGYLDTGLHYARVITVSSPNMTGPFSKPSGSGMAIQEAPSFKTY